MQITKKETKNENKRKAKTEPNVEAYKPSNRLISYFSLLMIVIAMLSFAKGGYMLAKAHVAQYLLNQAWQTNITQDTGGGSDVSKVDTTKPWPWADFYPVAKLSFDRLKVEQIILNNDSGQALAFGPGLNQYLGSDIESWSAGVIVISAHNDTHFTFLEKLRLNDTVSLTFKSGITKSFKVNDLEVIDLQTEQLVMGNEVSHGYINSNVNTNNQSNKELVLVTCYPFNGVNNETSLRYVVYLS